ncbi:Uncharacterised protein [uncultured archaeon]|nr:Uncharacterised protein [uncultured archaeon]
MIKIGIEISHGKLRRDILIHPSRYFFIQLSDGLAFLCFKTCNFRGEDIRTHIIDGLAVDEEGNLNSIFQNVIGDAILELQDCNTRSWQGDEFPISSRMKNMISQMPDLADWIISSILTDGRNIILCHSATALNPE